MTVVLSLVMFGSVPVKDAYLTCHGREAVRIVADPLMHLSATIALVMKPIREPATLAMVLEWSEPSSVTAHSVVPKPPEKSTLAKVALSVWLDEESLVAEAVETSAPRSTVAPATARSSLKSFMRFILVMLVYDRIWAREARQVVFVSGKSPFRRPHSQDGVL